MNRVCEYYFAPQSPWAYLGHQRFVDLAKKHAVKVDLKPVDLGKVFAISGGLPLAKRAPQRQAYRLVEMQRWSTHLELPMNLQPTFFPVAADTAAQLIIAAQLTHGTETALQLTGAIMRAVWAEQKNIADADTLAGIALDCDLDGKALLKSSETGSVSAEYERFTNEAIANNVFGVPWFVFNGESYWGQDRLDFLERVFQE
ncbi:2-hydroxychromene-2-carboxylate isomerase [Undibacterium sp. Jales W-56]|uniref:2-hydroxychromene-2-carboxylate isomerase n=1 Tax=Undibacterium sp. Jales W-56 TaxID=2897325 RepID=UPI0021D046EA|nr:2-hydroxychromene-2-carboxylate isomerase [Undibacterium sp. Jales W-56]MCU6434678.1 2-hydroxychromene-2-carboxylate isomerase [Undibacterium sp. Jales W-56]